VSKDGAIVVAGCNGPLLYRCRVQKLVPVQLPPHGPGHSVDVLFIRIPRKGAAVKLATGGSLDWDGAVAGVKALQDEVTEQLWPRHPGTKKFIGEPDDSAPWLRWSVRQRPHRKAKPPRKLPPGWVPGPPDPPNKGTELVEIWIAPREDCGCNCAELRDAVRSWWPRGGIEGATAQEKRIVRALSNLRKPCGCGRSTLPDRWLRGEL
jgi:hypothetical protein